MFREVLICFPFIADFCKVSEAKVELFIKSHKTSRSGGSVNLELQGDLKELFKLWVKDYRQLLISPTEGDVDDLFLNPTSGKSFNGKSFSEYFKKKAQKITGVYLNLQLIRRSFAEGDRNFASK